MFPFFVLGRFGWHLTLKYAIIPVEDGDLTITPAMAAKIEKARQEYREGKTLHFENADAAQKWMDEIWAIVSIIP